MQHYKTLSPTEFGLTNNPLRRVVSFFGQPEELIFHFLWVGPEFLASTKQLVEVLVYVSSFFTL